jgi:phospholipase D1/2
MEQKSGVSFNEAQVAMARQWLGPTIDPKTEQESIKISVLVPKSGQKSLDLFGAFEGSNKNDDTKVVDFALPKSEEEARQTIAQFESGAPRSDKDVSDSIGQHAQSDTTTLESEKWLGSEQEELDW